MLIGQSVLAPDGVAALYYSPWFPRQGNAFTAVIEFIRRSGDLTMTCQVQTKNNEDPDSSASNLSSAFAVATTTAATVTKADRSGALELVRYVFSITGNSGARWVHFRSNPPIWQPN